jgi:NADH:ubiquinone oxidoreductase subunit F (NADH-binding)
MPDNIQNGGLWVYSMGLDVNKLIDAHIGGMIDNNLKIFKSKGKPKKDTFCLNNGIIIQLDYTTMICTELDNDENYEL